MWYFKWRFCDVTDAIFTFFGEIKEAIKNLLWVLVYPTFCTKVETWRIEVFPCWSVTLEPGKFGWKNTEEYRKGHTYWSWFARDEKGHRQVSGNHTALRECLRISQETCIREIESRKRQEERRIARNKEMEE